MPRFTGKGQGNFDISSNGTVANPLTNMAGTATLALASLGTGLIFTASITNNVIVANNTVASNGIGGWYRPVTFGTYRHSRHDLVTIRATPVSQPRTATAFSRGSRRHRHSLKVKIQNNTVAAPLAGVTAKASGSMPVTRFVNDGVCLEHLGQYERRQRWAQGMGFASRGRSRRTNAFGVNGMAATRLRQASRPSSNGLNPAGNGTLLISATSGFPNCSLP